MAFRFKLTSLRLNGGDEVAVLPEGVTAVVGPNNSGKSRLLRDTLSALRDESPRVVVDGIEVARDGTDDEILDWFGAVRTRRFSSGTEHYFLEGQALRVQNTATWFRSGPPMPAATPDFLMRFLDAESRLSLSNPSPTFDALDTPPATALQRMFVDPNLEKRLSAAVQDAFGFGLVLNRLGGSHIGLHIGTELGAGIVQPQEYLDAVAQRPALGDQGDGVRSYVGILLAVLATPWPVLLIDEPEAFLHPPQARALGRQLADIAGTERRQILVATHSADIIRGLLDGPPKTVSVHRLTRSGGHNSVASLPAADVHELWSDPLLRFSRMIDGLFHTTVVVCESDADCRYYEAVLSSLVQAGEVPPRDWLFTHCGGKHRMPSVVAALQAVGVPVKVVPDLDVLREDYPLRALAAQVGVPEADFDAPLNALRSGVSDLQPQNPVGFVRGVVERLFEEHEEPDMTPQLQRAVRDATRSADGWSMLKRGGTSTLPQGNASVACRSLLDSLKAGGIHVVPVGELERWDPQIAGHGPGWVTAALEAGSHDRAGSPVWEFVREMAAGPPP